MSGASNAPTAAASALRSPVEQGDEADGDVEALALMLGLADEIDTAIAEAVKSLRAVGYSWAEIGTRLGITRQAAQQRWGTCH